MIKQLLILVLFIGCHVPSVEDGEQVDTAATVKKAIAVKLAEQLFEVTEQNIELKQYKINSLSKDSLIKAIQIELLASQSDRMALVAIQKRLERIIQENKAEIQKINYENLILAERNENINKKYEEELKTNKQLIWERNALESQLITVTELAISNVKVRAYGFRKSLKEIPRIIIPYETEKARKVEQIVVSCNIAPSKLVKKQSYRIEAIIHGRADSPNVNQLREHVNIDYDGKDTPVSISFDRGKAFRDTKWDSTPHEVDLLINGKLVWTGNLILK